MGSRRRWLASAVLSLLCALGAGCTPDNGPGPTPSPTPVSPTPTETPTETVIEREMRLATRARKDLTASFGPNIGECYARAALRGLLGL